MRGAVCLAMLLMASVAVADEAVHASGAFAGGRTAGTVSIVERDGAWFVRLEADFTHEGAPDPWVAFGKDGFRRDALISPLTSDAGEQLYPIPDRLDPAEFNQVYIWCEQFSSSLGRAWLDR